MFGCGFRLSIQRVVRKRATGFVRCLSTRKRGFQLDALPFTVPPSDAYAKFEQWANDEQGLGPLLSIGTAKITAAYAPFWYFDLNIRFVGPRSYLATPEPFRSAFPNPPNGVIHIPGLAAYAGFSYRRSLIDPVHNTTPVFLRKDIVPFGQWMLEPLKHDHQILVVPYPDPWNATREKSYSVVYGELHEMANEQYDNQSINEIRVETERISSRRIYMPTYIVEYTILGRTYRAYLSGCDPSVQVSGVSHQTIFSAGSKGDQVFKGATSFLSTLPQRVAPAAAGALQFFGLRPFIAIAQIGWSVVSRIAMKFHLIGLFGGALVAWRKVVRPYMDDRTASAEWERQRDYEAQTGESFHEDSFRDTGLAKRYFARNQKRILRSLSGEEGRQQEQESYEWYRQWEQWAKNQWEQAQREASRAQEEWQQQQQQQYQGGKTYKQYQQSQQQSQQQGQRKYKQAKKDDYEWGFDVNDPYSVLGIPRNSSKEEVSKAFRREMLKHHPDLQSKASEKEKRKATERSKLISDAYRKIKAGFKR
ncbi:hypothetical protein ACHAXR_007259 [Thalassiosira sp. AJA248-18]